MTRHAATKSGVNRLPFTSTNARHRSCQSGYRLPVRPGTKTWLSSTIDFMP